MRVKKSRVNLFHYRDYRAYLKDWFQEAKEARGSFSFRLFSKRAGFHSPNFLKLVMDGKRNLTGESLPKFVVGLKLNKQEQEFFENLVFFNQASTDDRSSFYYQRLLRSRKLNQLKPIEKHQYEYCSEWCHPVIREMVTARGFDGTPEWLANHIFPPITVSQAKKSLEILETLGFITRDKNGQWRQSSSLVSTGTEVPSLALFNYHMRLLDLTKEALEKIPASERDISSLTLGISEGNISQLKKKIQEFRWEILKLVSVDFSPDKVIQLNIQLFPVTRNKEADL